ncbi:hypothetical protein DKT68_26695 [Micromonospora acroterricola]|uniref:Uncharacterized protein n=1 Tax=Micromonospora acroterricola TaxID=2202421 RepID=A0A317CZ05_9ACTN|nr:hypothetical protein [Micromonospora acroterricola]PWR05573.1 hypothetical protein DKT68_26695 [Micromonospora acroterricola]
MIRFSPTAPGSAGRPGAAGRHRRRHIGRHRRNDTLQRRTPNHESQLAYAILDGTLIAVDRLADQME